LVRTQNAAESPEEKRMRRIGRSVWVLTLGLSLGGGSSGAGEPVFPAGASGPNFNCPPPALPAPSCPQPQPAVTPAPPAPEQPSFTEPSPLAETPLAPESALALGGETFAAAPNMIGHLLMASRSVTFRYNRAAGLVNVADFGSTNITNPAVADDESPIPRDRVSFRFNYFDSAQQVTGFGAPVFDPQTGVGTAFPQTRNFNAERYTFSFEKTFLDQWGSVELRIPFSTGLSSNLNLSAGAITGPATDTAFNVTSTPEQTLGSNGTQFDNMTLIFKGLVYRCKPLAVSVGLALDIPTGDDTNVRIIDYTGAAPTGQATVQRERVIHVDNETWSLSPFLAAVYTPTKRLFTQGFLQFDLPLNSNTINYSDTFTRGTSLVTIAQLAAAGLVSFPSLDPPFSVRSGITEQPLMQVDWGVGYWLLRDPSRTWITGIAPSLELHYTTTLKDASVVTLPGDPLLQIDPKTGNLVQEQPPRVGNIRNRVDIFDMTLASTLLVSDRATLATGVSFPLKGKDDRTFDWEFHLQLNYYFGGIGRRFAPNF
jgi:hypothetical protein